ncbi:MAG: hypothetical protein KJZ57_13400 [Anaerolineales bacterium]|nr:hypothetical protein [Anaerolineales bacterium]MDL1926289.1 hypothetical protein [Anaerolineae bacterium AMX1]NOG75352.1 hypothetical protein [Chloroflexota bacterium]WKZ52107.1 MAG: hypothetical protein QY329_05110 [Anaerolineales bacterium]WKZ54964.1 MAG: hypothetical protein QY324_02855 [Anaerolineales bacterium]
MTGYLPIGDDEHIIRGIFELPGIAAFPSMAAARSGIFRRECREFAPDGGLTPREEEVKCGAIRQIVKEQKMKKFFVRLILIVIVVSAFALTSQALAATAPPKWMNSHFVVGKGIVFNFSYDASHLRSPNIHGATITIHGNSYPLACVVVTEKTTISCTLRGGLTEFAGDSGSIHLLGYWYSVIIPNKSEKIAPLNTPSPTPLPSPTMPPLL